MNRIRNQPIGCPSCGGDNLHHYRVLVYTRSSEDSETGTVVDVDNKQTTTYNSVPMWENPSGRRDGLRILCTCETCADIVEISVVQHKGTTFLSTDIYEKRDR